MAVKLRLMRMGKRKQPTYRVVAADSRSPRNGRFIEIVGTYQPRQDPSVIEIDNDKAVHWLRHGAQPTERVEKLLKISGAWEEFTGVAPEVPPVPAPTPNRVTPLRHQPSHQRPLPLLKKHQPKTKQKQKHLPKMPLQPKRLQLRLRPPRLLRKRLLLRATTHERRPRH